MSEQVGQQIEQQEQPIAYPDWAAWSILYGGALVLASALRWLVH